MMMKMIQTGFRKVTTRSRMICIMILTQRRTESLLSLNPVQIIYLHLVVVVGSHAPCQRRFQVLPSILRAFVKTNTQRKWEGQPTSNSMPLGNLIIAIAICSRGQCSQVFNIVYACVSANVQYRHVYEDPVFVLQKLFGKESSYISSLQHESLESG